MRGLAWLGLLFALAWLFPLPLYLAALAVFGLPHVIWELGFLRSRYGQRWPRGWWGLLAAVMLLEAAVRGGLWLGWLSADAASVADLLVLLLAALVVVLAPRGAGPLVRLAGAAFALGLLWLLQHGQYLMALMVLAIAHNFTPLALAWDLARQDRAARPVAWTVTSLFLLPLAVAAMPVLHLPAGPWAWQAGLLDGQLPAGWGADRRGAWLSALVMAQCLHYYCVIGLLPRIESVTTGRPVVSPALRGASCLVVALLLAYYLVDFSGARKLYAVAAGVHAWLEWPLILMAMLSLPHYDPATPTPRPTWPTPPTTP